ncbi:transposase DNA-binding-containing protein [Bradyrhizobium sp. cir1]|uniref:IS4/Tn5 family transposase DNA-binding protein n=1 Tax=Bradyrhizobium sp. cir1 TaxID=1445730 RepID=UPI001FEF9B77|nr:transposase DNA-binding-containing protein [Bradyrhizobium sp. cir1]
MGLRLRDRSATVRLRSLEGECWIDRGSGGCEFRDARLGDRFRKLLAQIGSTIRQSIPLVCQNWANTKAAYRFFSNERVREVDILAGHFQSTRDRAPPLKVSFLCCTTQPSSAINAGSQKRSASPRV